MPTSRSILVAVRLLAWAYRPPRRRVERRKVLRQVAGLSIRFRKLPGGRSGRPRYRRARAGAASRDGRQRRPSPSVKVGITAREQRLETIHAELAALDQTDVSAIERTRLEAVARKHAADWVGLLKRHPAQGRSILAKVLRAKFAFKPERR